MTTIEIYDDSARNLAWEIAFAGFTYFRALEVIFPVSRSPASSSNDSGRSMFIIASISRLLSTIQVRVS